MYPFFRAIRTMLQARAMPPLAPGEVHAIRTRVWPWDIDMFMELNNGRSLTLMDLGRMPAAMRGGMLKPLREKGWRMTVAGSAVMYRRRVPPMARIEIRTRAAGRDAKFLYIEQAVFMGQGADAVPAQSAVFRIAVADRNGLVPAARMAEAMGMADWNPPLPAWIEAWSQAEALRPWPPQMPEPPAAR